MSHVGVVVDILRILRLSWPHHAHTGQSTRGRRHDDNRTKERTTRRRNVVWAICEWKGSGVCLDELFLGGFEIDGFYDAVTFRSHSIEVCQMHISQSCARISAGHRAVIGGDCPTLTHRGRCMRLPGQSPTNRRRSSGTVLQTHTHTHTCTLPADQTLCVIMGHQ